VTTIFLLFISTPLGSEVPDDTPIFLSSAIKVTPDTLDFSNMQAGAPRSTSLTVTNVSDNDISITPSMNFGIKAEAFLDSKLELCNSGACSPVTRSTKIKIPKGGHQELVVTVTMNGDAPKTISVAGDLKVIGEVLK
jgi:hypothetical protein